MPIFLDSSSAVSEKSPSRLFAEMSMTSGAVVSAAVVSSPAVVTAAVSSVAEDSSAACVVCAGAVVSAGASFPLQPASIDRDITAAARAASVRFAVVFITSPFLLKK